MNFSCIYKITNTISNKIYIGSTTCYRRRRNEHFSDLKLNKHPNPKLQNAYNKYGKDAFVMEPLVRCPQEYNEKMEQWFLDTQEPFYNIRKEVATQLGMKHTEETKKIISTKRSLNLIGQKFSYLTVIDKVPTKGGNSRWLCKCELCGTEKQVRGSHLKAGNAKSCGCLRKRRELQNIKHK